MVRRTPDDDQSFLRTAGMSDQGGKAYTPATHSNSGAEHPCPERSDRGMEKNIGNIGNLVRWQKGRWTPAAASADLERPLLSFRVHSDPKIWLGRDRESPMTLWRPIINCGAKTTGRDSAHRRIRCEMELSSRDRVPPWLRRYAITVELSANTATIQFEICGAKKRRARSTTKSSLALIDRANSSQDQKPEATSSPRWAPNPRPRHLTTSRAEGTPDRAEYLAPSELDLATTPDRDGFWESNGPEQTGLPDPKIDTGRIEKTTSEAFPPERAESLKTEPLVALAKMTLADLRRTRIRRQWQYCNQ